MKKLLGSCAVAVLCFSFSSSKSEASEGFHELVRLYDSAYRPSKNDLVGVWYGHEYIDKEAAQRNWRFDPGKYKYGTHLVCKNFGENSKVPDDLVLGEGNVSFGCFLSRVAESILENPDIYIRTNVQEADRF